MNWKYKIEIKHLFKDKVTAELVASICTELVKQLDVILGKSQKANITVESVDDFWNDLEEVRDNFDFLRELADGSIAEEEWGDYSFDGDFKERFNDYLEQLYNIGDMRVTLRNGSIEKLLWVG